MADDLSKEILGWFCQSFPPMIVESVLNLDKVSSKLNLKQPISITISNTNIAFDLEDFFYSVQKASSAPGEKTVINDTKGEQWELEFVKTILLDNVVVTPHKKHISLSGFWPLSNDSKVRNEFFQELARQFNYIKFDSDVWRERINCAPLSYKDYNLFQTQATCTPVAAFQKLKEALEFGRVGTEHLVSPSQEYYFRLVGLASQETTFDSFMTGIEEHIHQLLTWKPSNGAALAFYFSAHSAFVSKIRLEELDEGAVIRLTEWVEHSGDLYSILGFIESGIGAIEQFPWLEDRILKLMKYVTSSEPELEERFQLLSTLFIFVAEEFVKNKLFDGFPPFWVRLATIAQASMIERALIASGTSIKSFREWAADGKGTLFFFQALVDLRIEPRWMPDFISAAQLRYEFAGRIRKTIDEKKDSLTLKDLLEYQQDNTSDLARLMVFPYPFLPGPLEGNFAPINELPDDVFSSIKEELSKRPLDIRAFAGISNAALIFKMEGRHTEIVTEALNLVRFQLNYSNDDDHIFSLIGGLGTAAAATRSPSLANSIRILSRVIRRRKDLKMALIEEIRLALICAAAYEKESDWSNFLGEWITEISFDINDKDSAIELKKYLQAINIIKPKICTETSKAEASLESFLDLTR